METPVTLTREELYELVWKEPMHSLAPRFGLSDVALAKICQKLSVPRPWRGYWQQLAAGKVVRKPALPNAPAGSGRDALAVTLEPSETRQRRERESPVVVSQRQHEASPENRIIVPDRVARLHPLVQQARTVLSRGRVHEGRLGTSWGTRCLDVQVSPEQLDRALRIFNTLIVELERRGFPVRVPADQAGRETLVRVHEQDVGLRIDEPLRRTERKRDPMTPWQSAHTYMPSGTLRLRIRISYFGHKDDWTRADSQARRLEDRLNDVPTLLVAAAEQRRQQVERFERARKEEEEAARARQVIAARHARERASGEELERLADAWYRAERIRAFVAAAEQKSAGEDGDGLGAWFSWARDYAERTDPLRNGAWRRATGIERGQSQHPTAP